MLNNPIRLTYKLIPLDKLKRPLFIALLVGFGCAKSINDETLIDKDGLKYHPDTNELYSGKVFNNRMGGKKEFEGSYKDGKKNGLWTDYHENGQKKSEGNHKDGKLDGLWTNWYANGQKSSEITYKNGKQYIIRTYKDGKREGFWTWWYANGQKFYEDVYKDGELIESKKWDRDGNLIED